MDRFKIVKQVAGKDEHGREVVSAVLTFGGKIIGTIDAEPLVYEREKLWRFYGRGIKVGSLFSENPRSASIGSASGSQWDEEPSADEVAEAHIRL